MTQQSRYALSLASTARDKKNCPFLWEYKQWNKLNTVIVFVEKTKFFNLPSSPKQLFVNENVF